MRIAVKVGTSTLTHATGRLDIRRVEKLCKVLSDLKNAGNEIVFISSGAIGMGVGKMSLRERPTDMATKQAMAAVGQCELMYVYDKLFSEHNHVVAQILLTGEDLREEKRHQNFSNTLERLLELGVLPIVNENDTVSTEEVAVGDNDTLGALVAVSVKAELLIVLSDIDGLYTADPRANPAAELIPEVPELTEAILCSAGGKGSSLGTGGMATKLTAAGICMAAGTDMVIVNGENPAILYDVTEGRRVGTRFLGKKALAGTAPAAEKPAARSTQDVMKAAKAAAPLLAAADTAKRNRALECIADRLLTERDSILRANAEDVEAAREKLGPVMIDRLTLTPERIAGMAAGIRDAVALSDPAGRVLRRVERPNGLVIEKVAVPLGVIGIIYESRPNVTSDAAALALKAGSAVVLRGGKESFRSNAAIVHAIHLGLEDAGLPAELVGLVEDTNRGSARELMEAVGYIDLLIPRGGAGLIQSCVENAKVPCIQTGTGICHIYVDASADLDMALNVIENAKTSRPSVCNAAEVLLVHRDVAARLLPRLSDRLVTERAGNNPVELRLDDRARAIISGVPALDADFDTEFLDYIMAVRVVDNADEAIAHIAAHSTGHSDAILTGDRKTAEKFTQLVDSAAVYVNASTRFTDGGEFGLGCEMGISTQKLHARGPLGLEELTTYKYVIRGNGQTR